MRRFIRVKSVKQQSAPVNIVYHVRGAELLSQYRLSIDTYALSGGLNTSAAQCAIVYSDAIALQVPVTITVNRHYCFLLDIDENQPSGESVEVITASNNGITAEVYNENGVLVCSAVSTSTTQAAGSTTAPGEMTSVPGEEPGEMTSVPTEAPGEII